MISKTRHANYQTPSQFSSASQLADVEREALITAHLPKVKYLADRLSVRLPSSVEREDLYGAGIVGLLDAVDRFDASRGVAFTTFAEMRVRGAILDSLRALDWVSRSARRRARELQNAFAQIEQERGRAATEEELAAHLNITLAELQSDLSKMWNLTVIEIDRADEKTGLSLLDTLLDNSASPHEQYEGQDSRERLGKAVDKLPLRERQIVALYYLEELTMKEIGQVIGVTESRVSQLRTQAIFRLRNYLKN